MPQAARRPPSASAGDPFDALGDPHRRAIVELLAAGGESGRTVQQLADALPISRPAVSRHLRLLKAARLVSDEPRGTQRLYRLRTEGVDAVRDYLARVWGDVAARFRLAAENTTPMIDPLRLSLVVRCSPEHAFHVWTQRTSLWWPPSHTVTEESGLQVVFEPRAGGRIFERTRAGMEVDWGHVTAWEPPARLVYQWHINADPADATEVEIRFVPLEDGATRVEIEHRGWERLGDRGAARRDRNRAGWDAILPHFLRAAATPFAPTPPAPTAPRRFTPLRPPAG